MSTGEAGESCFSEWNGREAPPADSEQHRCAGKPFFSRDFEIPTVVLTGSPGARRAGRSLCLGLVGLSAACADEEPIQAAATRDGAADAAVMMCPVESTGDAGGAPSFSADVFPLVNTACAGFSCHNDRTRSGGLFLGPSPDEGVPDGDSMREVHESMLAIASTAPALRRVEPGSPERSFLMLKLDGCHAAVDLECSSSPAERPCGSRMPLAAPPWSVERRELVRAWIRIGAPGPE